jgi:hypothetical protein
MFQVGNQYGKKSKRGKSIDKEMKDKIRDLSKRLIESIDIEELTPNQRIALLKAVIPYVLPKDTSIEEDTETDTISPPAIIVFGDTDEYKAYKELSTSESTEL